MFVTNDTAVFSAWKGGIGSTSPEVGSHAWTRRSRNRNRIDAALNADHRAGVDRPALVGVGVDADEAVHERLAPGVVGRGEGQRHPVTERSVHGDERDNQHGDLQPGREPVPTSEPLREQQRDDEVHHQRRREQQRKRLGPGHNRSSPRSTRTATTTRPMMTSRATGSDTTTSETIAGDPGGPVTRSFAVAANPTSHPVSCVGRGADGPLTRGGRILTSS